MLSVPCIVSTVMCTDHLRVLLLFSFHHTPSRLCDINSPSWESTNCSYWRVFNRDILLKTIQFILPDDCELMPPKRVETWSEIHKNKSLLGYYATLRWFVTNVSELHNCPLEDGTDGYFSSRRDWWVVPKRPFQTTLRRVITQKTE
jgi:hypothetical protein